MDAKGFLSNLSEKASEGMPPLEIDLGALGKLAPKIDISGGYSSKDIPVELPGGLVKIGDTLFRAGGKVGFDLETPSGYQVGGGVQGGYARGQLDFPEELQKFGAPESQSYGTRGVDVQSYNAYLNTPSGLSFYGNYSPETEFSDPRYSAGIRYKAKF
jgi:hypothetical protein